MRESPRLVSREQLENELWGDLLPDSDTLRSHMYNLRKGIDPPIRTQASAHGPGNGVQDCHAGGCLNPTGSGFRVQGMSRSARRGRRP